MAVTEEGRHRLLSIDGGGVRGVFALEFLAEIERLLREESADESLVLGDWFDYIAGTSTGAIIATGLALGRSVADIQRLYDAHAAAIFTPAGWRHRLRHRYDPTGLIGVLQREFGSSTTLGSPDLRCLLMLGLRNATTGSPWPLSSNPNGVFNQGAGSNLDLPLWQLVRASAAAPTYFPAEEIALTQGDSFVFTDGAVTTLNNPALQLFLMATLPAYRLQWPTGPDKLLLVSVGTAATTPRGGRRRVEDFNLLHHARGVPDALIHAVVSQQDLVCRAFAETRYGPPIDSEVGRVVDPIAPLFAYVRYDVEATTQTLLELGVAGLTPARLRRLDDVTAMPALREFGRAAAAVVSLEHFAGFMDGPPGRA